MVRKNVLLIVDDMDINRRMLGKFWENDKNYEILEAESAQAALRVLERRSDINLILLDVVMPEMSGIELLERLKDTDRFMHIPVIMNTQNERKEYEEKALQMGADDFIFKPYSRNVIKKNVYERDRKDELTGIYNCENFYTQTKKMFALADPDMIFVLLRLNIVRFKLINELYGQQIGDEILIYLADLLGLAVGSEGTYARIEADNFACCIPIELVREDSRFAKIMKEGAERLEKKYSLNIHCGIYMIHDRSIPVSVMCDRARAAYKNIEDNMVRHYAYYDEQEGERYLEEQILLRDMKKAVEDGQFYIEIQPVFDTQTEQPVSAEALVRWNHPEKGMISPGTFIPLFEKSGLITKLDMYVWEEVCRILAELKKENILVHPVSVNASRLDFSEPELVKKVNALMEKYGLEKKLLKIEVTESAYTHNPQEIIKQVSDFRKEGYDVLMDDFGSGYSSLNTLKELPVNILKIDMKFINNLEESSRAASIVLSVVRMAELLGMKTVAEGVETQRQVEFLRNIGCDQIQGYYFSRPLVLKDYRELLRKKKENEGVGTPLAKPGILIIDDQKVERISMIKALGEEYVYYQAQNGVEALKKLKKHAYSVDLIITDIVMPLMDGNQFLKEVQEEPAYREIPIMVVTASEGLADEATALGLGAIEVIRKPYDPLLVRQRVKNVLKFSEIRWLKKELHYMKSNHTGLQGEDALGV